MADRIAYTCHRCGCNACSLGEARITGGFWSKVFDIEGRKFSTITCKRCRHTEFFEADRNTLSNIFDFFVG
jgi:uncharacterized protein